MMCIDFLLHEFARQRTDDDDVNQHCDGQSPEHKRINARLIEVLNRLSDGDSTLWDLDPRIHTKAVVNKLHVPDDHHHQDKEGCAIERGYEA